MAILSHYTSFSSALQILLSGKIKLGNIMYSNDLSEIEKYKNDEFNYFVFCTCASKIDSLMWFSYAKNKFGACITFVLKPNKQKKQLLKKDQTIGKWSSAKIEYTDVHVYEKKGFQKECVFKREKEYRFLCKSREQEIVANINWEIVEKVTLTLSSYFDEDIIKPIFSKVPVSVAINIQRLFKC